MGGKFKTKGIYVYVGSPGGTVVKSPPAYAGGARDLGLIPGLGRSPRAGNDNPPQYSCLENPHEDSGGLLSMGLQRVRHD